MGQYKNFLDKYYRWVVAGLLVILFILEATSARQETQTVDEGTHLAAGYSYLMKRDFRMNPEHPPLLKEFAAFPLLIINKQLDSPFENPSWLEPNEWQFAKEFIYNNTISADTIIFLGRLPMMLLSLILGLIIFRWSKELFGLLAGLFSLTLYVFSPDIIAHGRYITTDVGVTLFFLLTIYYFYKYLKSGRRAHLIWTGLFFGLAQASKFSAIFLIPVLLILFIIHKLTARGQSLNTFSWKKIASSCLIIFFIGAIVVLSCYLFEFKKPIQDIEVKRLYGKQQEIIDQGTLAAQSPLVQKVIHFTDLRATSGKLIQKFTNSVSVPAYSYFRGFVQLYSHNYNGHTAYLLGHYTKNGWWYYFPFAFLVKEPLSLLIFLSLIFIIVCYKFIKNKQYRLLPGKLWINIPFYVYAVFMPPLLYLLWSMTSHLNLGVRHILIIFPFVFIGVGYLAALRFKKQRTYIFILCFFLIFYVISSTLIYPHYLAYFNEISGGPDNGPHYLVDSNIDWGQDLKKLKKYMTENNIDHVCLSYFGQAKIEYYEIDYWYLPDNKNFHGINAVNCVVAISVTSLLSQEREYGWLLNYIPDKKIGYSIYVYDFRN